jgi:hypothetical protein
MRRSHRSGAVASDSAEPASVLPAWKAFVVQLSLDTVPGTPVFAGRVEHLSSGRRARFGSRDELLAVVDRLLRDIEDHST